MNNDTRLFAASVIQSQLNGKVKYELSDSDVLELYYTEPRLAALIEMDIIKLIDHHLVVNLKELITPKTKHLSAHAKRNKSACCIGIQYASKGQYYKSGENASNCTFDIILRAAGFLETMFMMMLSSTAGTISIYQESMTENVLILLMIHPYWQLMLSIEMAEQAGR